MDRLYPRYRRINPSCSLFLNHISLLTKAKSLKPKFKTKKSVSKDKIELAVACAKGDIRISQVAYALGYKKMNSMVYIFLARALSQYVREQTV